MNAEERKEQSWGHAETEYFIDLCIENKVLEVMESSKSRSQEVFARIQEEMAIGGYHRKVTQLYAKFGTLRLTYMKSGSSRSDSVFAKKLSTVFGKRRTIQPVADISYDHDDNTKESCQSDQMKSWEFAESEKFIDLCIENNIAARLDSQTENKYELFESLQDELVLAGCHRDTLQLIEKFTKLRHAFELTKHNDGRDIDFYDKLERLFDDYESDTEQQQESSGIYDVMDFIKTIGKNPIIWNSQFKCTPNQRDKIWANVAASYGLEMSVAKSKWRTLRDYITRTRRKPIGTASESIIQLIRAMSFMPIARTVLTELGYDFNNGETSESDYSSFKVEALQDTEIFDVPEHNGSNAVVKVLPIPYVKRLRKILPAKPVTIADKPAAATKIEDPISAPESHDKQQFKYVKLTSLAQQNNPAASRVFQLVNPLATTDPLMNGTRAATAQATMDDEESGYGMHVAQQMRKLPSIQREELRNQINNLMYNAIVASLRQQEDVRL